MYKIHWAIETPLKPSKLVSSANPPVRSTNTGTSVSFQRNYLWSRYVFESRDLWLRFRKRRKYRSMFKTFYSSSKRNDVPRSDSSSFTRREKIFLWDVGWVTSKEAVSHVLQDLKLPPRNPHGPHGRERIRRPPPYGPEGEQLVSGGIQRNWSPSLTTLRIDDTRDLLLGNLGEIAKSWIISEIQKIRVNHERKRVCIYTHTR